jgi:hypothetical protein
MTNFDAWFRAHFGTSAPVGHCLRVDHQARWLRLHSLPGSKRYAEDDDERSEVRSRAWAAASEVLPSFSPGWLVVPTYGEEPPTIRQLSLNFEQGGRYTHAQLELPILVHVAQTTWPHDGFEALIDEIARDALRLAWFSEASGEVFAPYDGGIDLIVDSPSRAQALRRRFPRDWFSTHASGL